tara:strand:- start:5645 stop:5908 length:264 start_codon:yes stop_codon:yes gene_type:complete
MAGRVVWFLHRINKAAINTNGLLKERLHRRMDVAVNAALYLRDIISREGRNLGIGRYQANLSMAIHSHAGAHRKFKIASDGNGMFFI